MPTTAITEPRSAIGLLVTDEIVTAKIAEALTALNVGAVTSMPTLVEARVSAPDGRTFGIAAGFHPRRRTFSNEFLITDCKGDLVSLGEGRHEMPLSDAVQVIGELLAA